MMIAKKYIKAIKAFLAASLIAISAQAFALDTDASLYGEITSAYASTAYPSVIEMACRMEKEYPRSLYIAKAMAYKGECQYRLSKYYEAEETLRETILVAEGDPDSMVASWYWLARTQQALGRFDESLASYYSTLDVYKKGFKRRNQTPTERSKRFNALAVYNAANVMVITERYGEAVPLYERVLKTGDTYTSDEYRMSILKLMDSYSKIGNWSKLLKVYGSFDGIELDRRTMTQMKLFAGDAYLGMDDFKKAYQLYTQVLSDPEVDADLASIALQKSYTVASDHKKAVGEEPGAILADAQHRLSQYPDLVAEFWCRLGIDEFKKGDLKKAKNYFDNAETTTLSRLKAIIGIYKAEITAAETEGSIEKKALSAIEVLDSYSAEVMLLDLEQSVEKKTEEKDDAEGVAAVVPDESSAVNLPFNNEYIYAYSKWYAMSGQYDKGVDYGKQALDMAESVPETVSVRREVKYYYALCLYQKGQYAKVKDLVAKEKIVLTDDPGRINYLLQMLYARTLSKMGYNKDAILIYETADSRNLLEDKDKLDWANVLLSGGYYASAYKQALNSTLAEGNYVAGLAAFNRNDWKNAETCFTKYCSTSPKGRYISYARFYNGYSQYKSTQMASAYKTLSDFADDFPDHEYQWLARITAANAALQSVGMEKAAVQSQKAVEISKPGNQYETAVLQCAAIYSDSGEHYKAINILTPSSTDKSDFGVRVRFQMAQTYSKMNEVSKADSKYGEIVSGFKSNPLADDSCYLRGALYYGLQDYEGALSRFEEYMKLFKTGKYVDAASYYLADCYSQMGNLNLSIIYYQKFIQENPTSPYVYSAKKNLVDLYSLSGDYEGALKLARQIASEYKEQASQDSYAEQIEELSHLAAGENVDSYRLESEYRKAGGSATLAGRKKGTELAEFYWKDASKKEKAYNLAMELYLLQSQESNIEKEAEWAARTASVMAQYLRQKANNSQSAKYYLESATWARRTEQDELAQQSLYGAVEAFDAAGQNSDALSTYNTMAGLYPGSSYTAKARALVK